MVTFLMTIIAAGVGAYLSTYLREKGKNLATKVSGTAAIGRFRRSDHPRGVESVGDCRCVTR